jgi:hypothetical protein
MRCFYCNFKVRWNNDFDTEDTYPESEYNIVSMYQCDECDTWYEVFHQKKEPETEIKNKNVVINYMQEQWEKAKQMSLFKNLRKEVEIGGKGTQRYVIKKGPNKGKIVG